MVLPLWARVVLGAMTVKVYSGFPKLKHPWNITLKYFRVISRMLVSGGSYPTTEMQSIYSRTPADWASSWFFRNFRHKKTTTKKHSLL